jgi:hypothetical protein
MAMTDAVPCDEIVVFDRLVGRLKHLPQIERQWLKHRLDQYSFPRHVRGPWTSAREEVSTIERHFSAVASVVICPTASRVAMRTLAASEVAKLLHKFVSELPFVAAIPTGRERTRAPRRTFLPSRSLLKTLLRRIACGRFQASVMRLQAVGGGIEDGLTLAHTAVTGGVLLFRCCSQFSRFLFATPISLSVGKQPWL